MNDKIEDTMIFLLSKMHTRRTTIESIYKTTLGTSYR